MLPQLRVADLVQRVDSDLYGGYAVVADEVAPALAAATALSTAPDAQADLRSCPSPAGSPRPATSSTPLEWWVFGGFALFVWVRYLLDVRAPNPRAGTTGSSRSGA